MIMAKKGLKGLVSALIFMLIAASSLAFSHRGILATNEPSKLFFMIGEHYFNNKDFSNAILYFNKTIELKPDFAEAYHNLGISFYYDGDLGNSISHLKKSIEIKKDYAKAHYSLALVYFGINEFDNALSHLLIVTELEPSNANAHFDLAAAYVEKFRKKEADGKLVSSDLEQLQEALKHYLKAEQISPGFANALSNAEIVGNIIKVYEELEV